jgi:hypothetical protein
MREQRWAGSNDGQGTTMGEQPWVGINNGWGIMMGGEQQEGNDHM